MTFPAAMRVGSLEILAAIALFGYVAARLRPAVSQTHPKAVDVSLVVQDVASRAPAWPQSVTVAEGSPSIIGRSHDADLELSDPDVSRRHARLDLARGVLYVADLGSRNGTFLNGKALPDGSIELRPGDELDIGNTRITVAGTLPTG